MEKQTTQRILMIEPVAFGYNAETAVNNYFQQPSDDSSGQIQAEALNEFREMVALLRQSGIHVVVIKDTLTPLTPDSIFPNNWISFHGKGSAVLYPMFAVNRRNERQTAVFEHLSAEGLVYPEILDLTHFEHQQLYLEGTGSMVLDRINRIAYAALSERTNKEVLDDFCSKTGYRAVHFTARQQVGNQRLPVYHTNVMMCIAEQFAVICAESIDDLEERHSLINQLIKSGKEIIEISEEQMHRFAGNMLQLVNQRGELQLVLSTSAYESLNESQLQRLKRFNELIVCRVPVIEKHGGGSVRCMIAELF
jgi:hypothetical protein